MRYINPRTFLKAVPDATSNKCGQSAGWRHTVDHHFQRLISIFTDEFVALAHLPQQHSDRQLQILTTTTHKPCLHNLHRSIVCRGPEVRGKGLLGQGLT